VNPNVALLIYLIVIFIWGSIELFLKVSYEVNALSGIVPMGKAANRCNTEEYTYVGNGRSYPKLTYEAAVKRALRAVRGES